MSNAPAWLVTSEGWTPGLSGAPLVITSALIGRQ